MKLSSNILDVNVKYGSAHGSFMVSNILVDQPSGDIAVIGFQNCVPLPLLDICTLLTDLSCTTFLSRRVPFNPVRARICAEYTRHTIYTYWRERIENFDALFHFFDLLSHVIILSGLDNDICAEFVLNRLLQRLEHNGCVSGDEKNIHLPVLRQGSVTVIVPAAGRSSRFPGTKPKWLLTQVYRFVFVSIGCFLTKLFQPSGVLMVVDALRGLDMRHVSRVIVGVLREHLNQYCGGDASDLRAVFSKCSFFEKVEIIVLPGHTRDQVDTVRELIDRANVQGPIYVKDCDNSFSAEVLPGNLISTFRITRSNDDSIANVASKAYCETSPDGVVYNIVEKCIVSSTFCIGGYSFADARHFCSVADNVRHLLTCSFFPLQPEVAVSDVIYSMILVGTHFVSAPATEYEDWGTLLSWQSYCRTFRTLFVDIDGVLVHNSGEYFAPRWGETDAIEMNADILRRLHKGGRTKIVLTSARTEEFRDVTLRQLKNNNIPFDQIVFCSGHCQRIIVNDYASTNPFPACSALNLPRNEPCLSALLR